MRRFFTKCLLPALLVAVVVSCSDRNSMPEITHLPFKALESGYWGLIGTDGVVLFEDEYENEPSVVVNGIFSVKWDNGNLSYFTAEERPKSLNEKTYVAGGFCTEDLIPVVEEGQGITFIKKNGEIAFAFDEFDNGYKVRRIIAVNSYFSDGLCLFRMEDDRYGYIDTKGRVVRADYLYASPFNEGIAVVGYKIQDECEYDACFEIINTKGESIAKLKVDGPKDSQKVMYSDGLLYFGGKVFDRKGNIAFRLPSTVDDVGPFYNGHAFFEDKDGNYGLLDNKGEIVVRAQYEEPMGRIEDRAFFCTAHEKFECLDLKGNQVFQMDDLIIPVSKNRCIVSPTRKNDIYFVDKFGKAIDKNSFAYIDVPIPTPSLLYSGLFLTYIYNHNWDCVDWVHSDYYDASNHVASVLNALNKTGVGNISLGMSVVDLRNYYNMGESSQYFYDYWNNFEGKTGTGQLKTTYKVQFTEYIADYSGYNRDAKVSHVFIDFDYDDVMVSNARERIRNAVLDYLEKIGFCYDGHSNNWRDKAWDIYCSEKHDYLIAVSESGLELALEKQ